MIDDNPLWFRPKARGFSLKREAFAIYKCREIIKMLDKLDTYVYVDGFNLYYGCLKNTPYKWLDLKKLCQSLLNQNQHNITKIKYFTARVNGKLDPKQPIRQASYLRALEQTIPELEIYYGHFLTHSVHLPSVNPPPPKSLVYKTEEKGSDVNLAVHLVNDAWKNLYECAVLISNDSDLSESLKLVKIEHPHKKLGLIIPHQNPSKELSKQAHFIKKIRPSVLANAQLPENIPNTNISKPRNW